MLLLKRSFQLIKCFLSPFYNMFILNFLMLTEEIFWQPGAEKPRIYQCNQLQIVIHRNSLLLCIKYLHLYLNYNFSFTRYFLVCPQSKIQHRNIFFSYSKILSKLFALHGLFLFLLILIFRYTRDFCTLLDYVHTFYCSKFN